MHHCPICNCSLKENPRYPNYICNDCSMLATDINGVSLSYGNVNIFGGISAVYTESKVDYKEKYCYIKGVKCIAIEGRFGGIVIEKVD